MITRRYNDGVDATLVMGELRRSVDRMAFTEGRLLYTAALLPSVCLAEQRAGVRPGRPV